MMNDEWGSAFGGVPVSFENRVRHTVIRMQAEAAHSFVRHGAKLRLTLVIAAVMLALLGTALALASLGVLDTLNENLRQFLQPKASELVQTYVEQAGEQPMHATFTVEQALNDGHQTYVTVRVHGDKDTLLMDEDANASTSIEHWKGFDYQYQGQTFSNRAHVTNRRLVQAICEPVDELGNRLNPGVPEVSYDGEDILYNVAWPSKVEDVSLRLYAYDVYGEDKPAAERLSRGALRLTVPVTEARRFYSTGLPVTVDFQKGQFILSELLVEQTPIATYVTYALGASDPADSIMALYLKKGFWMEWLDEKDEPYPEGVSSNGLSIDEAGNNRCTLVYRAFDELPDRITLRFSSTMSSGASLLKVDLHPVILKEEAP